MGGQWRHDVIVEIRDEGDALGLKFEDRTWAWIPTPPLAVVPGDRVSSFRLTPDGYTVRLVIGELEVPTFYALEMARRREHGLM